MKKTTKIALIAVVLMGLVGGAFAADKKAASGGNLLKTGDFSVDLGIGFGYWYGFNLAFYPRAEFIFYTWDVADKYPVNFGVAVKGYYSSWSYTLYANYTYGYTFLGLGAFVTGHFGLKSLNLGAFFDRVEVHAGLGLAFNYGIPTGTYWDYYRTTFGVAYTDPVFSSPIGFATYEGVTYFITDNFFVFAEYNYWSYASSGTLGLGWKF